MNPIHKQMWQAIPQRLVCAVLACALWPGVAQAQVRYFERPPTVAELRQALAPRAPASASSQASQAPLGRSRGIEWQAPGPVSSAPAVALPVTFDKSSAHVSASSSAYVQAVADLLASDPSLRLLIEGHTDATGQPTSNLMLSWDRAFTVFRLLVSKYRIDPVRLQPMGKGAAEPLDGASPVDGANRRVQFRVMG
jgi:outer membrane protein OmpA-like peptidoglycan-associated protein